MEELNRNQSITIGTSPVVVSKQKDTYTRKSIILINTSSSSQEITLAIDGEAQSGAGIVLSAGGVWSDTAEGGYTPTQKLITGISSASGGTLAIQERLIK